MNWQKYTGLVVILLALYGAGVGTGAALWYGHTQKQVAETVGQAGEASGTVLPDLTGKLVALERDKTQLEEALKHASDNAGCIFTRGDVSLLNRALTGLPDAAGFTAPESRTPAALTQREEITAHADCGTRYRTLAARHNALIDWLELSGRK